MYLFLFIPLRSVFCSLYPPEAWLIINMLLVADTKWCYDGGTFMQTQSWIMQDFLMHKTLDASPQTFPNNTHFFILTLWRWHFYKSNVKIAAHFAWDKNVEEHFSHSPKKKIVPRPQTTTTTCSHFCNRAIEHILLFFFFNEVAVS